jgi:hypothetical protein
MKSSDLIEQLTEKVEKMHFLNLGKSRQNLGKTVVYDKMDVRFVISDLDYLLLGIFRKKYFWAHCDQRVPPPTYGFAKFETP